MLNISRELTVSVAVAQDDSADSRMTPEYPQIMLLALIVCF